MRKKFIFLIISFLFLPLIVNASSGKINVSSTSTVVVGNKVTVTVTLSGSDIGSWQMTLNYDKSYLQLTSSSAEAGGTVMASSVSSPISSKKYTFTFKTLKKGSTTVSVKSYEAYAFSDFSEISLTSSNKTIKIITQEELEASYSKDNNLKSLSIEGYNLDQEFNKDETDYTVTVPEGTTSVMVKALANDNKASVSGDGTISVSEGSNVIKIVVRAENGSEKVYNLTINVIDQNPINVTINNNNYTVIKLRSNYECPSSFTESNVTINDLEIPSCYNEKLNYNLVGLKLSDGTIENYIYDNNEYVKYNEAVGTSLKLVVLDYNDELEGLNKYKEKIDGVEYNVFKTNANSKFSVVYGIDINTGKKDFYTYDNINKTFILYDNEQINNLNTLNQNYLYIIIFFGIGLFLSIIIMISLTISNKKIKKMLIELKTKEEKEKLKTKETKEVKENKEETKEVTKEEPKKKKRKKKQEDNKEEEKNK